MSDNVIIAYFRTFCNAKEEHMAKKTKFIFTETLAKHLAGLPEDLKRAGFGYAMNYGLGRCGASELPAFEILTREIDRANEEKLNCTAGDIREIVDYLNETCNTAYRADSAKTRRLISARFGEGRTVEDFRLVIRHMHRQWMGSEQEMYLRPETLFGSKFEGYLQDARRHEGDESAASFDGDAFFAAAMDRSYGG